MISSKLHKKEFERHMVRHGDALSFPVQDGVHELHGKLETELASSVACPLTEKGRRMNNFCIGSDPEFVFAPNIKSHKMNAFDLGLRPGLAAGSDQNLRLAELRGYPTTSAVEHVAGLLASLRWMYRLHRDVLNYQWISGAHFDGDGIGGHVHFGRKRPDRDKEVLALDGMTTVFRKGNFFNNANWDTRVNGDARGQRYGDFGDIRPQLHGYEYRTLPSWLCSPMKAFVVLTASKLAVLDPDMTIPWRERRNINGLTGALEILQRFARYYAGRDDDAWILKHLIHQPHFLAQAQTWFSPCADFKYNWGFALENMTSPSVQPTDIMPVLIKPDVSEVAEVALNLNEFKPLRYREVAPTFKNILPNHYFWMYQPHANGVQYAGAGDVLSNLVGHEDSQVDLRFGNGMYISKDMFMSFTPQEQRLIKSTFPYCIVNSEKRRFIQLDRNSMGVSGIGNIRKFLLRWNLFPLWTIDEVEEGSYLKLKKFRKVNKTPSIPLERRL